MKYNYYNFMFERMIEPYIHIVEEITIYANTNHISVCSFFVNRSGLKMPEVIL